MSIRVSQPWFNSWLCNLSKSQFSALTLNGHYNEHYKNTFPHSMWEPNKTEKTTWELESSKERFQIFLSARDLKKVHEQCRGNPRGLLRRGITTCFFYISRQFYVDWVCSFFKK